MGTRTKSPPIILLFEALKAEGIAFMLAGMSAANLQGVLEATVDVDVWVNVPPRQYPRVINLCRALGATVQSPNKVYLSDDTPVDFLYEVDGLKTFREEHRRAKRISLYGRKITALTLSQICKSKEAVGRDKDKLHILMIRRVMGQKKRPKIRKASR